MSETLIQRIRRHEGQRLNVYDDATGHAIGPGSHVIGNPTIGVGRRLCGPCGISQAESDAMLTVDIDKARAQAATLPVYSTLDPARQDVLVEMVFQLGLGGVQAFQNTLKAMWARNYVAAAAGMLASQWARQTPQRARELATIMQTGVA